MVKKNMESEEFLELARHKLVNHFDNSPYDKVQPKFFHLVWFARELQNMKGLFMLHGSHKYWEVTYNGDKNEMYVDTYNKVDNTKYELGEE